MKNILCIYLYFNLRTQVYELIKDFFESSLQSNFFLFWILFIFLILCNTLNFTYLVVANTSEIFELLMSVHYKEQPVGAHYKYDCIQQVCIQQDLKKCTSWNKIGGGFYDVKNVTSLEYVAVSRLFNSNETKGQTGVQDGGGKEGSNL